MTNIVEGDYGGAPIRLNKDTGILTMANKQGVLFRVKLINRLFGNILSYRFFSPLIKQAGIDAGEDYAVSWLMENAFNQLSNELKELTKRYKVLQETAEQDSMNPQSLTAERIGSMKSYSEELNKLEKIIRTGIGNWLAELPKEKIKDLWQQMHDEDVFAGWGRASLISFSAEDNKAEIELTTSFISRLFNYWDAMGKTGEPVCSFFEGYFLGEAQVIFSRENLICVETHCRLQGAEKCAFIIEPDPSWL